MNTVLVIIVILLFLTTVLLIIRLYSFHKRINGMIVVLTSILEGQKKRQIFTKRNDDLGQLAFEINRLAGLYGTAQEKYEKEQLAKKQLISNLSHDVRTPLVSVIGYLEAIEQDRIAENQKDDYIHTAYAVQRRVLFRSGEAKRVCEKSET